MRAEKAAISRPGGQGAHTTAKGTPSERRGTASDRSSVPQAPGAPSSLHTPLTPSCRLPRAPSALTITDPLAVGRHATDEANTITGRLGTFPLGDGSLSSSGCFPPSAGPAVPRQLSSGPQIAIQCRGSFRGQEGHRCTGLMHPSVSSRSPACPTAHFCGQMG